MSYDINLYGYLVGDIPTRIELASVNITYNVCKMLEEAFGEGHFKQWQDEPVSEFKRFIKQGIDHMKLRPEYFTKFESPNGWGTYPNTLEKVEELYNHIIELENQGYDLKYIFLEVC